jgi:hypothetical protein
MQVEIQSKFSEDNYEQAFQENEFSWSDQNHRYMLEGTGKQSGCSWRRKILNPVPSGNPCISNQYLRAVVFGAGH